MCLNRYMQTGIEVMIGSSRVMFGLHRAGYLVSGTVLAGICSGIRGPALASPAVLLTYTPP